LIDNTRSIDILSHLLNVKQERLIFLPAFCPSLDIAPEALLCYIKTNLVTDEVFLIYKPSFQMTITAEWTHQAIVRYVSLI